MAASFCGVYDSFAREAYACVSGQGIAVESPKCVGLVCGRTWNGKPGGLAFRLAMPQITKLTYTLSVRPRLSLYYLYYLCK